MKRYPCHIQKVPHRESSSLHRSPKSSLIKKTVTPTRETTPTASRNNAPIPKGEPGLEGPRGLERRRATSKKKKVDSGATSIPLAFVLRANKTDRSRYLSHNGARLVKPKFTTRRSLARDLNNLKHDGVKGRKPQARRMTGRHPAKSLKEVLKLESL